MDSLVGDFFIKNGHTKPLHIQALTSQNKISALLVYFASSWAPPCSTFLPLLKDFYDIVNKDEKKVEVLFISCDKSVKQFQQHFAQMPWFALGYNDSHIAKIQEHCDVECIPKLIALHPKTGAVLVPNLRPQINDKKAEAYSVIEDALNGGAGVSTADGGGGPGGANASNSNNMEEK